MSAEIRKDIFKNLKRVVIKVGSGVISDHESGKAALERGLSQKRRDGWLRRQYNTPGFAHTIMLINTVGYLAEAAWHHPDLSAGYAHLTVKLQTHRVRAVTTHDTELARKIDEVVTWLPGEESPLDGFPKKWIH